MPVEACIDKLGCCRTQRGNQPSPVGQQQPDRSHDECNLVCIKQVWLLLLAVEDWKRQQPSDKVDSTSSDLRMEDHQEMYGTFAFANSIDSCMLLISAVKSACCLLQPHSMDELAPQLCSGPCCSDAVHLRISTEGLHYNFPTSWTRDQSIKCLAISFAEPSSDFVLLWQLHMFPMYQDTKPAHNCFWPGLEWFVMLEISHEQ